MLTSDHLAFGVDLRVDVALDTGAFKATIAMAEIDVHVEAIDANVTDAVRIAAEKCAERLGELGYDVTPADVLGALETGVEPSQRAGVLAHACN